MKQVALAKGKAIYNTSLGATRAKINVMTDNTAQTCVVTVHAMKAYRGSKGITPLIFNLATRRWVVNLTLRPIFFFKTFHPYLLTFPRISNMTPKSRSRVASSCCYVARPCIQTPQLPPQAPDSFPVIQWTIHKAVATLWLRKISVTSHIEDSNTSSIWQNIALYGRALKLRRLKNITLHTRTGIVVSLLSCPWARHVMAYDGRRRLSMR
jgi:hypothetical protein